MQSQGGLTGETELMEAVQKALLANDRTSKYPIEVIAQGDTITLTGDVEKQEDKDEAERIARGVSGVVDVIDELVVRPHHGFSLFGGVPGDTARSAGSQAASDAGTVSVGNIVDAVTGRDDNSADEQSRR